MRCIQTLLTFLTIALTDVPSQLLKCFCVLSQGHLTGGILFLTLDCTKRVGMPKDGNYSEGSFTRSFVPC